MGWLAVLGCKDERRHLRGKARSTVSVHPQRDGCTVRRRKEGWLLAGWGHSRSQREERPEAKNSQEAARAEGQQLEASNPCFNMLLVMLLQYIFYMFWFVRKKMQPFVIPLAELYSLFFSLLLHNPYLSTSVLWSYDKTAASAPRSPAFPLRQALGACKPRHPVPSTRAYAEDTAAVLMQ